MQRRFEKLFGKGSSDDKHMRSTKCAGSDINFVDLKTRSNQYGYLLKVAANCDRETAVLYRDNESAIPLIDSLDRNGIDYRIKSVDMAFFTNRVVVFSPRNDTYCCLHSSGGRFFDI